MREGTVGSGCLRSSTISVMTIANTPSLSAFTRSIPNSVWPPAAARAWAASADPGAEVCGVLDIAELLPHRRERFARDRVGIRGIGVVLVFAAHPELPPGDLQRAEEWGNGVERLDEERPVVAPEDR